MSTTTDLNLLTLLSQVIFVTALWPYTEGMH